MTLHPLDRPRASWSDNRLQQYMAFCILDTNSTYRQVCNGINALVKDYEGSQVPFNVHLSVNGVRWIKKVLHEGGYPWYNQKARYLVEWARSRYSDPEFLRAADRTVLANNIKGIGMKLASMYVRNTRSASVAVIDRRVTRWLGYDHSPRSVGEYYVMERKFIRRAQRLGKSPYVLDMEVWEEMRVKR